LDGTKVVHYILLQEYIQLGQRVKAFRVEIWKDGKWETVATATTIGYKRILEIEPVETDKLKINFTASKASLVISNIEVY
jgi:alpha-L-fucosidase